MAIRIIRKKYENHGMSKTHEYMVYCTMKSRCLNPKNRVYRYYGGRGIKICVRWIDSFENFIKDMGKRPNQKLTLERVNNNKGYFPSNCKWATREEQNSNKRKYKHNKVREYNLSGRFLKENQYRALKIIQKNPQITASIFAKALWGNKNTNMFTKIHNIGNGACAGSASWLCAGSYIGILSRYGLVKKHIENRWVSLTDLGESEIKKYETNNQLYK
jgi:hypothetical protein